MLLVISMKPIFHVEIRITNADFLCGRLGFGWSFFLVFIEIHKYIIQSIAFGQALVLN